MRAVFYPSEINGVTDGVSSKSYAHRALILSHFSKTKVIINQTNDDIEATKNCLLSIADGKLFCGESGSTLRFMLPLLAAVGGDYEFTGKGRLMARPNEELYKVLKEHGVKVVFDGEKIKLKGKLSGNEFKIRGDISSQYVSGLLMALPLIGGGKIQLTTPLLSKNYVDITLSVMQSFGVKIKRDENSFTVNSAKYKREKEYIVPADWSSAAFPLSLGAIGGIVTVKGLDVNDVQGDKCIIDVLNEAGAKVTVKENSVTVKKDRLNAFCFDAGNFPDTVPVLSSIAANCNGVSKIENIERLRLKESDRVKSVLDMVNSIGGNAYEKDGSLYIKGGKILGGKVNSYSDHRIAMSAGIMATNSENPIEIDDALCVNKSYPSFYEDYKKLGGKVNVE